MIDSGSLGAAGTDEFDVGPIKNPLQGHEREIYVRDDGDASGTVAVEASPDDGTTWFEKASLTLGSVTTFKMFPGERHRINLTGGTAPALTYWIF